MNRVVTIMLFLCLTSPALFAQKHGKSKSSSTKTHSSKSASKSSGKEIECTDGTKSHAENTQGACSHHGGIKH